MRAILPVLFFALLTSAAGALEPSGCRDVYAEYPASSEPLAVSGPEIVEKGPIVLAGLEEPISGSSVDLQIDVMWTRFEQRNQWIANPESDARTGVCFNGGAHGSFDFFAGQVLSGAAGGLPEVFSTLELPATRYGVFVLTGSAGDIAGAQALIYQSLLPASGLSAADAPDMVVFPADFYPPGAGSRIELWVPLAP